MSPTEMESMTSNTDALDVKKIRSIELADGWHNVTNCEYVQFAIGVAHSPVNPSKYYPSLRYKNETNKTVRTPLSQIISFSEDTNQR